MRLLRWWNRCLIIAGVCALAPAPGLRARDLPSADEVIKKVIERAQLDPAQKGETSYVYSFRNVVEVLDDHGSVKERRDRLYEAVVIDGEHFNRLVRKDDKPLTAEDQKREQEREEKFRQTAAERKQKKETEKGGSEIQLNQELFDRFKIEIVDRESVNGRSVLVATFEPKRKDLPTKRRIDLVLNKLGGKIWIDEQDYELAKAQFHLTGPVSKFMGILANLRKFDGAIEQIRLDDGTWFPNQFENYFEGRIVFKSLRQRTQLQWTDFRKVGPEGRKTEAGAH